MHTIVFLCLILTVGSAEAYSIPAVARISRLMADLENISTVMEKYNMEQGGYPDSEQAFALLVPAYVDKIPTDPWGREYMYEAKDNYYRVWSFGKDGVAGGVAEDFDYSSNTAAQNAEHRKQTLSENTGFLNWYTLLPILALLVVFVALYCLIRKVVAAWLARKSQSI